jgi:Fe-S cluster biogenesis protein NfuA|tara:strand:- start:661 stop:1203 length:543 start_codon:yes stop_codon:yes gene_type:complete
MVQGHNKETPPLAVPVNDGDKGDSGAEDRLAEAYGSQIEELMRREAERRISESVDPIENERLLNLSLCSLVESDSPDIVPALMSRLGPVRAALDGHGGALVLSGWSFEKSETEERGLSLIIDLDGACVSCGAAPGTLKGIQDDLLMDSEVYRVRFDSSMLEWFDELQREFVLLHGGVTFV